MRYINALRLHAAVKKRNAAVQNGVGGCPAGAAMELGLSVDAAAGPSHIATASARVSRARGWSTIGVDFGHQRSMITAARLAAPTSSSTG